MSYTSRLRHKRGCKNETSTTELYFTYLFHFSVSFFFSCSTKKPFLLEDNINSENKAELFIQDAKHLKLLKIKRVT